MKVKGAAREASISAVVTRANGTVEDLGVIARWHRSPLIRLKWRIQDRMRRTHGDLPA